MRVDLPEEAYAAALASTPAVGPATCAPPSPTTGLPEPGATSVRHKEHRRDVLRVWQLHAERGIGVVLADDLLPRAPPTRSRAPPCCSASVILSRWASRPRWPWSAPRRPRATESAYAGTIRGRPGRRRRQRRLGTCPRDRGAAHEGACGVGASPVGVVAGGLDKPYPARHARLWQRVGGVGAVVSSRRPVCARSAGTFPSAIGSGRPERRRHRRRESSSRGSAPHRRSPPPWGFRWVRPGSIRSATSEGTNALLADGAFPVCSTADILVALSLRGMHASPAGTSRAYATGSGGIGPARDGTGPSTRPCPATPPPWTTWLESAGLDLSALCGAWSVWPRPGVPMTMVGGGSGPNLPRRGRVGSAGR